MQTLRPGCQLVVTGEQTEKDFVFARFNYGDGATTDHSQMEQRWPLESTMAPTVLF